MVSKNSNIMLRYISTLLFIIVTVNFSCAPKVILNYKNKTTCLSSPETDGNVLLKAWGNGASYIEAVESAKKNALYDILFNGIYEGSPECSKIPIISDLNARTKFEKYFNIFFAENGEYQKFIQISGKFNKRKINEGVLLQVETIKLKQKLLSDNIIK